MSNSQAFELRLRLGDLSEEVEDRIAEQLDGAVSHFDGVAYVTLCQDASDGVAAAHEAIAAVVEVGAVVMAVDPDFVTRSEIAERLDASRQAVALWAAGQRQSAVPFPKPVIQAGATLWCWSDVAAWARAAEKNVDGDVQLLSADEIAVVNGELASGRMPVLV